MSGLVIVIMSITVRVHYSGVGGALASASNSCSREPGVDAGVGYCGSVHERQRPVSLKMDWKPTLRPAPL